MTSRQDKVIRLIGDVLVGALSASVALAAIHPEWAWLAVIIAMGKAVQKFVVTVEGPPQDVGAKLPLVLLAVVALGSQASCGHVPGGGGGVIQCGSEAVQKCAPQALPAVNDCLAGNGDVVNCLVGLISPVGCLTQEAIACVVRKEGSMASAASQANPDDTVDAKRAARAKEYLSKRDIHFAD